MQAESRLSLIERHHQLEEFTPQQRRRQPQQHQHQLLDRQRWLRQPKEIHILSQDKGKLKKNYCIISYYFQLPFDIHSKFKFIFNIAIDLFGERVVGHHVRPLVMEAIVFVLFDVLVNLRIKLWTIVIVLTRNLLTLPIVRNSVARNGEPVTGVR